MGLRFLGSRGSSVSRGLRSSISRGDLLNNLSQIALIGFSLRYILAQKSFFLDMQLLAGFQFGNLGRFVLNIFVETFELQGQFFLFAESFGAGFLGQLTLFAVFQLLGFLGLAFNASFLLSCNGFLNGLLAVASFLLEFLNLLLLGLLSDGRLFGFVVRAKAPPVAKEDQHGESWENYVCFLHRIRSV